MVGAFFSVSLAGSGNCVSMSLQEDLWQYQRRTRLNQSRPTKISKSLLFFQQRKKTTHKQQQHTNNNNKITIPDLKKQRKGSQQQSTIKIKKKTNKKQRDKKGTTQRPVTGNRVPSLESSDGPTIS